MALPLFGSLVVRFVLGKPSNSSLLLLYLKDPFSPRFAIEYALLDGQHLNHGHQRFNAISLERQLAVIEVVSKFMACHRLSEGIAFFPMLLPEGLFFLFKALIIPFLAHH